MFNKIDWHYHLSGKNVKKDVILLKEYIKEKDMSQVYIMSSYFPKNGSGISNFNVYHHIKNIDKTKMYLSLDFENYYFMGLNEINTMLEDEIIKEKIIGIKIYSGYQNIDYKSDKFKEILKISKENNLYLMFHTGYLKGNKENFNPIQLENIIKENKDIKIIIAHLSNPFIDECIYLLNKYDNLYSDISGLIDKKEEIEYTIKLVKKVSENVNSEKILFGTDFPMQNYEETMLFCNEFKQKDMR